MIWYSENHQTVRDRLLLPNTKVLLCDDRVNPWVSPNLESLKASQLI